MGTNIERYKGIEFVRISAMSQEQQQMVWESFDREKIIKIVTEESLMNDCILYTDFVSWKDSHPLPNQRVQSIASANPVGSQVGNLAFE